VDFGQFLFKRSKFVDPSLNEAQLFGHKRPQAGAHSRAPFGLKVADQGFEIGQREAQGSATDEQQPTHIRTRILPVARVVPGCRGEHPDFLIVADGLGRRASGSGELADGQHRGSSPQELRDESLHIPVAGGSRPGADPHQTFGAPQANAA
jgi:hypothetical protein